MDHRNYIVMMLIIDAHIYEQLISDHDTNICQQKCPVLSTMDDSKIEYLYFKMKLNPYFIPYAKLIQNES